MSELDTMEAAVTKALATYDDNRAWASGELVIEYAEAGGMMGSDSAFKPIDRREFAERLLNALNEVRNA